MYVLQPLYEASQNGKRGEFIVLFHFFNNLIKKLNSFRRLLTHY